MITSLLDFTDDMLEEFTDKRLENFTSFSLLFFPYQTSSNIVVLSFFLKYHQT